MEAGDDERLRLRPVAGTIRGGHVEMPVRGMAEDDDVALLAQQRLDVVGAVLDVQVGVDRALLPHEAEVPIGDAVAVQPLDGLADRDPVEVLDHQAVGDDPDPDAQVGEAAQGGAGARDHPHVEVEVALHHRESMHLVELAGLDAPFGHLPADLGGQQLQVPAEPLRDHTAHEGE